MGLVTGPSATAGCRGRTTTALVTILKVSCADSGQILHGPLAQRHERWSGHDPFCKSRREGETRQLLSVSTCDLQVRTSQQRASDRTQPSLAPRRTSYPRLISIGLSAEHAFLLLESSALLGSGKSFCVGLWPLEQPADSRQN